MMRPMKLILTVLSFVLLSCSENIDGVASSTVTSRSKFEYQMEYAMTKSKALTRCDDLVPILEKYYELQTIKSGEDVESLIDEMFSPSSYIVIPESETNRPLLYAVHDLEEMTGIPIRTMYEKVIEDLRSQIKPGMIILETVWTYDGNEYLSKCVVSEENGVLFDPIGSYIVEKASSPEMMMSPPLTLNESESQTKTTRLFEISDCYLDVFGIVCYEYSISCQSEFTGNILTDYNMAASHTNAIGWSCCARIEHLEGTIDESTYHSFAWGWGYSSTTTVSISFAGTGFSISGSSHSSTGTEVHKAQLVE